MVIDAMVAGAVATDHAANIAASIAAGLDVGLGVGLGVGLAAWGLAWGSPCGLPWRAMASTTAISVDRTVARAAAAPPCRGTFGHSSAPCRRVPRHGATSTAECAT